jgi:rubrerythrin
VELSNDVAPEEIHHHDVVHFALGELRHELSNTEREQVLDRLKQHLQDIIDRRVAPSSEMRDGLSWGEG